MYKYTMLKVLMLLSSCVISQQKLLRCEESECFDVSSEIHDLKANFLELSSKFEQVKTASDSGSTYVHWGRSDCPSSANITYSGMKHLTLKIFVIN